MRGADLRGISLFDGVPDGDLDELAAAGEEVRFGAGDLIYQQGRPADYWWVLLEGRIDLVRRAGHEDRVVAALDQPGRWMGGFRAWDEGGLYIATARGAGPGRVFRVRSEDLGAWARKSFPLGVHLLDGLFRTVRSIEAGASEREALIALGRLSAGLAHEMNNPAAAASRNVDALHRETETLLSSLTQLAERGFSAASFRDLDALRRAVGPPSAARSALETANREEAVAEWLEARGLVAAWQIAPTLAAAGLDVAWCERAEAVAPGEWLEPALTWIASTLSAQALLEETKEAMARISALVAAVKSYSQMDRAALQVVDVTEGLESTLVMLGHRLRPGVEVVRRYGAEVPRIEANPAELNQVWTNLIDNAVDAMGGRGTLEVATRADDGAVVVEVVDSGPGMPPEVQAHAFEPFFTTKEVGKGTGLGLDISRRIVTERHGGTIEVESRPGRTVMRVRLPAQRDAGAAG